MDRRQFLLKSAAGAILASYGRISFGGTSGGDLAGELARMDGLALAEKR